MHRVEHVMGMPIVVEVRDEGVDEARLDRVFDWFRWVDAVFSTYRYDSQVSRINRGELDLVDADPRLVQIFRRCEELRAATGGFFDVRAASVDALDPSGLVKGWSVDEAAALLERDGIRSYAVNAGGDARVRGGIWRIGIQHPLERHAVARVIETSDLAVATSGEYARGRHVLDPHTGRAPEGVLSVTVTGPDLATADAYATAAFAMGARAPYWSARLRGYEAMTILEGGEVFTTPGFP
jgi:thiamine biosynthesis lipoprotein